MNAWEWAGVVVAGYLTVSAVATLLAVIVGRAIVGRENWVPGSDGGGPLDDHGVEPWEPTRLGHYPLPPPPRRRHRRELLICSALLLSLGVIFGVAEWTAAAFVIIVGALILAAGA
jgi:hypothetical protein